MTCRDCTYFEDSRDDQPRSGLEGYGYCRAAPSLLTRGDAPISRSHFIRAGSGCYFKPSRQERRHDHG